MRRFRLTLILLIVALLPVRGMLAAAMPCPPSSGGVMGGHPFADRGGHGDPHVQGDHGAYAATGDPAGHHRSPPAAAAGDPDDHRIDAGHGGSCAALCAAFPLATPSANAPLPADLAQARGGEPLLPPLRLPAAPASARPEGPDAVRPPSGA